MKHEVAIQELKLLATSMLVLHYYDVSKPVTIQSDASQRGLSCCAKPNVPDHQVCFMSHHSI